MDPLSSTLATAKSVWVSLSFLVAIVIWVYRLRADTNKNTQDLKEFKEKSEKDIENNKTKIDAIETNVNTKIVEIKHDFEFKIEKMKGEIHDEIRSIKTEVKTDLKEHAEKEVNRAIRIFEKLDEIQKDLVDMKINQAKNGNID